MALTPEQIYGLRVRSGMDVFRPMKEHWQAKDDDYTYRFARAIEAEVRKDDDALILQLVEALEQSQPYVESCANGKRVQWWGAQLDRAQDAINAGRARLEKP